MFKSFFKISILYLIFLSNAIANINSGSCDDDKLYVLKEGGNNQLIYFWESHLVDAFNVQKSESTYGYSYGNKLDCVKHKKEIQNWDVQLIAARYAHDTDARFPKFNNISDKEFCDNASDLLLEYCDPNTTSSNNNSTYTAKTDSNSLSDYELCKLSVWPDFSGWKSAISPEYDFFSSFVREAASRDLSPEICKIIITGTSDQPIQEDEPIQENEFVYEPTKTPDVKPPVIKIDEYTTISKMDFRLLGKVTDDSPVFIEIDGEGVAVNDDDTFEIEGSVPVGFHKIQITAFDVKGNKSSANIIVERVIESEAVVFEPLNPKKLNSKKSTNRVALVIGIENYENISQANYAKSDAQIFIDYVQGAFGVPQNNIKYFFNESAKKNSKFVIRDWFKKNLREDTEVFIYFSGHGLALNNGEDLYLLTHDTIVEYIDETSINRNEIFNDIAQYNPKSVTVFLDTCYSGAGRADGEMLLAMAKGLVVVDEQQQKLPDNFTLFTAASAQESAWSLPEAQHGTFSYFLMKGMEGKADLNGDKKLTNGELRDYLLDNVGRYAQQQQTPQMVGDPDQVLIRF